MHLASRFQQHKIHSKLLKGVANIYKLHFHSIEMKDICISALLQCRIIPFMLQFCETPKFDCSMDASQRDLNRVHAVTIHFKKLCK
ncbi:CLUMA_CG011050, isoform E [Clunio marinus]|uniref:CLUMA_CG011050, isoform E n=1 Tax=Clunio marinus TaxID=568069 RepID=A0A1J1ID46_9DIPT|nr:CLUMA_CG011050, isoform E [Clunio marinus]